MQYAVITPTYKNHFPFVQRYLQSFVKYVADKDKISLYFIISKNEKNDFDAIIRPYKNKCNINVLFCEDLFKQSGMSLSADELLKKYGRFSFQTFKKLYAVLSIPEEKSLILDSESMWVRKTSMQRLFADFFAKPRIYGSILEPKYRTMVNFNQMVKNIDYLLGESCPYWFLENYMWFYEKKIVQDLVKQYGNPLDMAEKLRLKNLNMKIDEHILSGIFEITLYQNFIYFNLQKYKYDFINMDELIKKYLSSREVDVFKSSFYKKLRGGCGLTEHVCLFLKKNNVKNLAQLFKDLQIKILRCDRTDAKLYPLQKKFLNIVQPCILASSQGHCFGLNNTLKNRVQLMLWASKTFEKLKKHVRNFITPIKKICKWCVEPFSIVFYFIKFLLDIVRHLKIVLLG